MGQYYKAVLQRPNCKVDVYNPEIMLDDDSTSWQGYKLMEHSWIKNKFVNAIASKIYNNPMRVAWVGDYSDDDEDEIRGLNHLNSTAKNPLHYVDVWNRDEDSENKNPNFKYHDSIKISDFEIDGKYLINHDIQCYIDCDEYIEENKDNDNWCIHLLPLLTVVGNGKGGGDYHSSEGIGEDDIGTWCWCKLEISNERPPMNYTKTMCYFLEDQQIKD